MLAALYRNSWARDALRATGGELVADGDIAGETARSSGDPDEP